MGNIPMEILLLITTVGNAVGILLGIVLICYAAGGKWK